MTQVLIDACGWVACVDASINIERSLEGLLGPCEWVLLSSIHEELKALQHQRSSRQPLLLSLLEGKATRVKVDAALHPDDALLAYAIEHGCVALTVDNSLKHRLYEANIAVIEVRQNNHLNLIESL